MPRGQRTSRGERAPRREPEGPRFEAKEPEQDPGFDDPDDTKFGKKQEKLGRSLSLTPPCCTQHLAPRGWMCMQYVAWKPVLYRRRASHLESSSFA